MTHLDEHTPYSRVARIPRAIKSTRTQISVKVFLLGLPPFPKHPIPFFFM